MAENNQNKIEDLHKKLQLLLDKQVLFQKEINHLKKELYQLSAQDETEKTPPLQIAKQEEVNRTFEKTPLNPSVKREVTSTHKPQKKSDLEKYIGENLINKIGIVILVLGVGIGAKYAIDNELISPLSRIILGYLIGLGLIGFALKLKKEYENFSAVLLSGSMAILYFISFIAYSFYALLPQSVAFVLMVIFTIFTVIAALNYNRQVIAHIGLVGAYAVPFLLSDGSGNAGILFTYMVIINIGVLLISLKRYWKPLLYNAFFLSWLIYLTWYFDSYTYDTYFSIALLFSFLFFITFYVTLIAYKILKNKQFLIDDIVLLIFNSFLFFAFGYGILSSSPYGDSFLGLFTVANALIHFIFCVFIYKQKFAKKNIFYFISGLVLVFITIAIPIQLDGNWVTLLWGAEAALLFFIGRKKGISLYEKLTYPLLFLSFISLCYDWSINYNIHAEESFVPIFNTSFLSSFMMLFFYGFILWVFQQKEKYASPIKQYQFYNLLTYTIPFFFLFTCYYSFRLEIEYYWDFLYQNSQVQLIKETTTYLQYISNKSLEQFKTVWVIIYSLFFMGMLNFISYKKIKNKTFSYVLLVLNILMLFIFLLQGLWSLSELRESYLSQDLAEYYEQDIVNLYIRYIAYLFFIGFSWMSYKSMLQSFTAKQTRMFLDLLLHLAVIWIVSSELIHWLDVAGFANLYKTGLSILWGVYALFLIALGINKSKKHIRISAIVLFGITLIKLFLYDISQLNTVSKTIVFVSLGALLLVISFLYNKHKNLTNNETED